MFFAILTQEKNKMASRFTSVTQEEIEFLLLWQETEKTTKFSLLVSENPFYVSFNHKHTIRISDK